MAESAASLVIEKLALLLVQEAKLLKGIDQEVTTIRNEMEMIQSFLKDADRRSEKDESNVAKTWVTQVREEAYHIEDVIDQYMLHFAKQPHRRRQCLYFLQKIFHITKHIKDLHVIASEIQGINKVLENIRRNGDIYGFNAKEQGTSSSNVESDTWHDPRMESFLIEEAEVVGIEFYRDELIDWLIEGSSNRMVCSVVGIGGLGKTTLVKKVYDNDKVVPHFDCQAWITVSQSFKMDQLLRDIIKKFYKARKEFAPREIDTMEESSLVKELNTYLLEQRYLLVLDDMWDTGLWDHIKRAFPDNAKGNRIIITTRNVDVAPSNNESQDYSVYELEPLPFDKALELFYKKAFQCLGGQCPEDLVELSNEIVEKCGGLPLAVVAIGGLFSTKAKVESEWRKLVFDSLSSEFETNSRLRSITKILSFSYQDLPYNLKACFLYFGMFPEDYTINCATLTWLWIAEGFVKEKERLTLEDVAQDFLNQLIRRSLVQVDWEDFTGRIRNCRVHDMMHEIILKRLEELGIGLVSMTNFSNSERTARRLSIQNNVNTRLHGINNSQTRSILILEVDEVPNSFLLTCFANFKLMKVMDFEGAPIDCIPKEVGSLFHLRYLSLRDTKVQMLPKSIGKLHNLETLDLKRSLVLKLPMEIGGLRKLRYLAAYNIKRDTEYNLGLRHAVKIPNGIGRLESLQKLFNIEATNATIITELGSLAQLRKLAICKLKKENGKDLCTMIQKLSHLRSLEVTASEEEVLNLQPLPSPPPHLQTLCLSGQLEKLPEWISKLKNIVRIVLNGSKLMEDPLKVFQALPNLMSLSLNDGYGGEQLHIEGGGFQKLKDLALRNLGGLNRLIIDEGALPLLEQLTIKHCPKLEEVPSGIHHLKSLKYLDFYDMPTEFVLSLQPDEGPNFGKVEHIPSVTFWYRTEGKNYDGYDLGELELLEYLKR